MKYLHQILKLEKGVCVKVHFNRPAKVMLMNDRNFLRYQSHTTHTYWGGNMDESPYEFTVPYAGIWHVVVEKGGYFSPLDLQASVTITSNKN